MSGSSLDAAASVLVRPAELERRERAALREPPNLDPIGQCPYCHHDLMKKDIRIPMMMLKLVQTFTRDWDVLLTYWVCMNEECCLMFWRHPRLARWVPPTTDDTLEH